MSIPVIFSLAYICNNKLSLTLYLESTVKFVGTIAKNGNNLLYANCSNIMIIVLYIFSTFDSIIDLQLVISCPKHILIQYVLALIPAEKCVFI